MRWRINDAAKIGEQVYRVIKVAEDNCPVIKIRGTVHISAQQDSWENAGSYVWNWNPFKPGWNFNPVMRGDKKAEYYSG